MKEWDLTKFIFNFTAGEFVEFLREQFPMLSVAPTPEEDPGPTFSGRILYNGHDVETFFKISHKTASDWINGWMAPAVKREGKRKFIVDADYALKLMETRKAKKQEK